MSSWKLLPAVAITALSLIGCGTGTPPADVQNNTDASTDTSMPPADTSTTDAQQQMCVYPSGPYGVDEGRLFRPWALNQCATGEAEYRFDGPTYCENVVTLMVASAGWCVPCQREAPDVQAIHEEYAARGVRVIGVYFQNTNYGPPTAAECRSWATRYGQTHAFVTDPQGAVQIYFPNMAFPANIIVDQSGRIRFRQYGAAAGLQSVRDQLDAILAEYGR